MSASRKSLTTYPTGRETIQAATAARAIRAKFIRSPTWNARSRLIFGDGLQHHVLARELLDDRQQPRVEEADLEQDEERHRAVDPVGERVEHRGREVETERDFDHRLHDEALAVLLADPFVGVDFDAV